LKIQVFTSKEKRSLCDNTTSVHRKKVTIMTNTSVQTHNEYAIAMQARIELAKKKDASASNMKRLHSMLVALSNEALVSLLKQAKVKASEFSKAIYASDKVIKFAQQAIAINSSNLNEMTYAIFKSAVAFHNNNLEFTKQDACAAISKSIKIENEAKNKALARRNNIFTTETVAAQSQTSLSALKSLNILQDSVEKKNVYVLNVNDLTKKLCENFKIELVEAKAEKSKAKK